MHHEPRNQTPDQFPLSTKPARFPPAKSPTILTLSLASKLASCMQLDAKPVPDTGRLWLLLMMAPRRPQGPKAPRSWGCSAGCRRQGARRHHRRQCPRPAPQLQHRRCPRRPGSARGISCRSKPVSPKDIPRRDRRLRRRPCACCWAPRPRSAQEPLQQQHHLPPSRIAVEPKHPRLWESPAPANTHTRGGLINKNTPFPPSEQPRLVVWHGLPRRRRAAAAAVRVRRPLPESGSRGALCQVHPASRRRAGEPQKKARKRSETGGQVSALVGAGWDTADQNSNNPAQIGSSSRGYIK